MRIAAGFGIPGQNLLVADSGGHIGWTIAGRLPRRGEAEAGIPQLSTDAAVGFAGWLAPQEQPHLIDPADGLLWSANARVVGGPAAALIGDDGMDRGARAGANTRRSQARAPRRSRRPPVWRCSWTIARCSSSAGIRC